MYICIISQNYPSCELSLKEKVSCGYCWVIREIIEKNISFCTNTDTTEMRIIVGLVEGEMP